MANRDIVVIGASIGGIEAITTLLGGLPADLPAALFVVVHVAPQSPGFLAEIFDRAGPLTVRTARNGERFVTGTGYVAPADRHLILEPSGHLLLTRGPRENRTRPAADPLFRSAALAFGPRVIGVVLSGGLDDGSAGLRAIKMCGGTAVVQHPADAAAPSMPVSALRNASVDHCVPAAQMGPLINQLARSAPPSLPPDMDESTMRRDLQTEAEIAKGGDPRAVRQLGTPSVFTCPECHGSLLKLRGERPERYRCHTGHAYTPEALLSELREVSEHAVWNAVRSIQEASMLLSHLADHWRNIDPPLSSDFARRAKAERTKADTMRELLLKAGMEEISEATDAP